jgi:hypothetical protein
VSQSNAFVDKQLFHGTAFEHGLAKAFAALDVVS